jgi:hypothetical protein
MAEKMGKATSQLQMHGFQDFLTAGYEPKDSANGDKTVSLLKQSLTLKPPPLKET